LRQTAVYVERDQPEFLLGLIHTARRTIIPLSIILVMLAAAAAALFFDPIFLLPLLIALPSVVIRTSALIWEGVLRGLDRVDESFIPTYIVYPVLMLFGIGSITLLGDTLTSELALVLYLLAFTVATLVSWLLARRRLKPIFGGGTEPAHPAEGRFNLLLPFTTLTMLGSLSVSLGTIMLGLLDLPDAVGVLSVALKLVEPMLLVFGVVSLSLSAQIAGMSARGRVDQLESAIARTVRMSLLWAAPIGLLLILFPDVVLELFGQGFEEARTSLLILVPAFLFSVLAGIGPAALMMTEHQRETIIAKAIGLALNLLLCLALIPAHGASAAALALAVDIVVTNVIAVVLAWKLLGLNTTALPTPAWMRKG
jgi:O-antigen/teichoic acid export membrane protein